MLSTDSRGRARAKGGLFERAGRSAQQIARLNPWTNVYGLGRSLVAMATMLTLATTPPSAMWSPFFENATDPLGCQGIRERIALFCVLPADRLTIAHWLAVAALVVVASGWRPRLTGVVHWWISFSMLASATRDGGEQVAALITLFLIPWTLTDDRAWHWQAPTASSDLRPRAAVIAHVAHALVRLQLMVVYLHSGVTKFGPAEWTDGTAVFYWVHDPIVGSSPLFEPLVFPLVGWRPMLVVITWAAILAEFVLVAALVIPRRWRWPLFWLGVVLHGGIALVLGVTSFSIAMIGGLVLYLRPLDEPFRLPRRAGL